MDVPLSVRIAIGAPTTTQGRTADTSTAAGTPPGAARLGGLAPSTAAVDHCGVCTGLDGPIRPSFRPNRSAAEGTTTDSPSDGVPLDGTHQQRLRLPGSPPPVTRRPA
ncbi:hypothetical protein ACIBJF_43830 [Streptomyces sp. NPDC050743]|uniref:hypothetical protein n=1 Tax=Streptomyces sp. NPDC050743 TaxID=3365634 RepID=UPI00378A947E